MKLRWLPLLLLPALLLAGGAPSTAQKPAAAAQNERARAEIERILEADNLDSSRLSPREVAETIAGIGRGRAPEDFWNAYLAHVRAWQHFAQVFERSVPQQGESTFIENEQELLEAERAVETTFDEVQRIARRYGARLPVPPGSVVPTV